MIASLNAYKRRFSTVAAIGFTALALAAWIYPTASDGVVVSRAYAGDQGEQGWGLYLLDGKLQVNLSQRYADDGLRVESRDVLPLNEWQHVLVSYDGKLVPEGFRIYVNGDSREVVPLLDGINNPMRTREPLRIGASGPPPEGSGGSDSRPRFQGMIDDVRIYTAALTAEQAAVVATSESLSEIARIGVVGAGQMGNGIAHVMALAGYDVVLNDVSQEALDGALGRIEKNLDRQVSKGKLEQEMRDAAVARISTTPFPGGARMRSPLLVLAMTWFSLRDRLGI